MTVITHYGDYRPVQDRHQELFERFPPDQGFGVEIRILDLLQAKPGLAKLYSEAIRSNRNLSDCGLPPMPSQNVVLIEARLVRN